MTVREVFRRALAMLPVDAKEDMSLEKFAVDWINVALSETLAAENSIRKSRNEGELSEAPTLGAAGDEIPYDAVLSGYAFVYFLASLIAKEDGDAFWAEDYRRRYIFAAEEAVKINFSSVGDVYGGPSDA